MTKAAKAYRKDTKEFFKNNSTSEYIAALEEGMREGGNSTPLKLVQAQGGYHRTPGVGTWAHPKLAVFFARWLDVKFAVWCDMVIDSLLRGQTTINIQVDTPAEVLRVPETAGALRASATYAANMARHPDSEEALHGFHK